MAETTDEMAQTPVIQQVMGSNLTVVNFWQKQNVYPFIHLIVSLFHLIFIHTFFLLDLANIPFVDSFIILK